MAREPLTHSSNSLLVSLSVSSGAPVMKEEQGHLKLGDALHKPKYILKKCSGSHVCQSVKASKELIEGSNQILGRQVHRQQSETLDVCKKDATGRRKRQRSLK